MNHQFVIFGTGILATIFFGGIGEESKIYL